jgi:hypothetical protein
VDGARKLVFIYSLKTSGHSASEVDRLSIVKRLTNHNIEPILKQIK